MLKWTINYRKEEGAAEDSEEDGDSNNTNLSDNSHSFENPRQSSSIDDSTRLNPDRRSGQVQSHSSLGSDRDRSPGEEDAKNTSSVEGLERTSDETFGVTFREVESHSSIDKNRTGGTLASTIEKNSRNSSNTIESQTETSFTSSTSSKSASSSLTSSDAPVTVTKSSVSSCETPRTGDNKTTIASVSDRAHFKQTGLSVTALFPSTSDISIGTLSSSSASSSSPKQHHHTKMATALPDVTKAVPGMDRESLGPEVEWEEEDLTIAQIADMDKFPCIGFFEEKVREKNGQWEFLSAGLKIYSKQPVLFQMRSRKRQARARTIFKDPSGALFEVGQTMLIPDDYKGWFELVPSDFSRATCYMSIADLAKVMPRKFFTRSNFKGIRVEGEGEDQKYLERKVPAGSVLETKGTFTAKWRTSAETGTFKKKTKEWEMQEVTYLKCIDHDKMELLVPLTQRGKFNAIYERGQLTQNAVYSMKDILSDLSLPIKVRLLFGKAPVVPCIFTGMLVIRSAAMDDAVVGSTVLNTRNVLFEIPIDAPVKAKYTSSDETFEEMASYKDAQKLCKKYAKMFSTMIKLSPELDTDQKTIQHVPSDPSVMRQKDESLRALDLITDISLTGEPKDHLLDSDSASMGSEDQNIIPKGGTLSELTEYKSRESHTHV